jgi:hypothetical protein
MRSRGGNCASIFFASTPPLYPAAARPNITMHGAELCQVVCVALYRRVSAAEVAALRSLAAAAAGWSLLRCLTCAVCRDGGLANAELPLALSKQVALQPRVTGRVRFHEHSKEAMMTRVAESIRQIARLLG